MRQGFSVRCRRQLILVSRQMWLLHSVRLCCLSKTKIESSEHKLLFSRPSHLGWRLLFYVQLMSSNGEPLVVITGHQLCLVGIFLRRGCCGRPCCGCWTHPQPAPDVAMFNAVTALHIAHTPRCQAGLAAIPTRAGGGWG